MRPVPKGKWAWEYDCCTECKTTKVKHRGKGLCERCSDRKRYKNLKPIQRIKRDERTKIYRKDYYEKHKETLREKARENYKKLGIKYLRKKYLARKFERFLKRQVGKKWKNWDNGLEIIIDGERVKTPIRPPSTTTTESNNTIIEIEIFKKVYAKLS